MRKGEGDRSLGEGEERVFFRFSSSLFLYLPFFVCSLLPKIPELQAILFTDINTSPSCPSHPITHSNGSHARRERSLCIEFQEFLPFTSIVNVLACEGDGGEKKKKGLMIERTLGIRFIWGMGRTKRSEGGEISVLG